MNKKIWLAVASLVLLVYLLAPGPSDISDFGYLPNSDKSTDPGDTVQIPNIVAYYSFNNRDFVTKFFRQDFRRLTMLPFPPIRLNYPPEYAYQTVKDQTQSTFLEEYVYPLRNSLYVNGFEPFYEDGTAKFPRAVQFGVNGKHYNNKDTLRFYPSSIMTRLVVWLGLNLAFFGLYKVGRKVLVNG